MAGLLRACYATYFSGYGSLGENKWSRRHKNRTDSLVPILIFGGVKNQPNTLMLRRSRLVVRPGFHCGLVCIEETSMETKIEEAGLLVLDGKQNEVVGLSGFHKTHIPKVVAQTSQEPPVEQQLEKLSYKHQSRFKISDLQVHFLEEKNEGILSNRVLNLSRSNKIRSALELYLSMDVAGLRSSAHACNSLLACLVRNGLLDDALLVFDLMRKKRLVTCHAYSLILKAVASAKGYQSALEMFHSLEEEEASMMHFDIVVYNTMILICGKVKNWVETHRIWRKFKQSKLNGTNITYSLLISAFLQCGHSELAVDAYQEMIVSGLDPDEDIMKAAVASCTKGGNWTVALKTFKEMLERGMKPSIITYNSVINCLGRAGEEDLAFKVFVNMKSSGLTPDVCTWSALLTALYTSKRYSDALRLFEIIKALHVSQMNAKIYDTALMSCQKLGLWERSLQILWEMETSGVDISTVSYNHVIHACETARRPEVALQVYQNMIEQKCSADTFTHLSLIRACIWGSLWTEVTKILECIPQEASLYNALVQGFCLRGRTSLAKKMYEKMRSSGLKPDGKTRAMMVQHLSADGTKRRRRLPSPLT